MRRLFSTEILLTPLLLFLISFCTTNVVRADAVPTPADLEAWSEQATLYASDAATLDYFGRWVVLKGDAAVVGAFGVNDSRGAAYLYARNGTTWTQTAEFTAPDGQPNDCFGRALAIDGNTVVIGAFGTAGNTGTAYVFVNTGAGWTLQAELQAPDGAPGDYFARSVALTGNTLLVGAFGHNALTGAVYAWTRVGSTWKYQSEIVAPNGVAGDSFGRSVALDNGTAAIGAYQAQGSTGTVYVYVANFGAWTLQAQLFATDAAPGSHFGYLVSLENNTLVTGAHSLNDQVGAAYVFFRSGIAWAQQAKLLATDGVAGDLFGYSVALSGNTVVVGAIGASNSIGAAYIYERSESSWIGTAKLTQSGGIVGDAFGYSTSASGNTVLIGAYGVNDSTGAAYVFVRPCSLALEPSYSGATLTLGYQVSNTAPGSWIGFATIDGHKQQLFEHSIGPVAPPQTGKIVLQNVHATTAFTVESQILYSGTLGCSAVVPVTVQ